jgi:MFS family permease
MSATAESLSPAENRKTASTRRILATTLGAHVLHDGFADLLYVLLPVWQAEFGLALAEIGMLKTVYSGVMAGLQVPAGLIAERFGERALLAAGTAAAGIGYLLIGWTGGFLGCSRRDGRQRAASARIVADGARCRGAAPAHGTQRL